MARYSQLYIERGKRTADSPRARRRLASWFIGTYPHSGLELRRILRIELGYEFVGTNQITDIRDFFETSVVNDFLDSITLSYGVLERHTTTGADDWRIFAERVFREENCSYRIDASCVVHPFIDCEFAVNQSAALEALNEAGFGEARKDFEEAFRHLRNGEGKAALRMMFPAVETTAKVLFPGALSRLMPNEVGKHILPCLRERYAGNQPAIDAGTQLLEGMKAWIVASQPYRHGQEQEGPIEPPKDFVIAHLSAGATYLRWMIELCG
jgi:hypothetical protein